MLGMLWFTKPLMMVFQITMLGSGMCLKTLYEYVRLSEPPEREWESNLVRDGV